MDTTTKFYFPSLDTQFLFFDEFQGQISDGYWENTRPYEHYKAWCFSVNETEIDAEKPGRTFYAIKDNYSLANTRLLDCVGDRMLLHMNIVKLLPSIRELAISGAFELPDNVRQYNFYCQCGSAWTTECADAWEAAGLTREIVEQASKSTAYTYMQMRRDIGALRKAMKTSRP